MIFRAELENIYEDEVAEVLAPAPPDGGWGWVIVAASFTCNLILDGIAYSFGVLLGPLVTWVCLNKIKDFIEIVQKQFLL